MLALKLGKSLPSNNAVNRDTYSLQFTGTEYLTLDGRWLGAPSTTSGSVSLWTKVSTMTSSGTLFRLRGDSDNYLQMLYHSASNEMRFARRAEGGSETVVITDAIENDGRWHHILATWADGQLKIYLDGALKDTNTSATLSFGAIPAYFDIGQNTSGGSFYKGYVDEFAFFNGVIPVTQLLAADYIADQDVPTQPVNLTGMAGLVTYFQFNEGSGAVAVDSSGEEAFGSADSIGTLVNSPTWTTDTILYQSLT
tara:strand:- start:820 stop:1578 length:759 start_codon:yes stop_codon:yes gene_type:complete